jgi:hypothetical protein
MLQAMNAGHEALRAAWERVREDGQVARAG